MHTGYNDIKERIDEEPTWYDVNGCPRYGEFTPEHCPNIYARTVVLLCIACQACGEEFCVEMHGDVFSDIEHPDKLHYGDPPIHDCVGDTMNCEDLEVLQVWHRDSPGEWERHPELEGPIGDRYYRPYDIES